MKKGVSKETFEHPFSIRQNSTNHVAFYRILKKIRAIRSILKIILNISDLFVIIKRVLFLNVE